jgi:hypothetical protein
MKKIFTLPVTAILFFLLSGSTEAVACHGVALVSPTSTITSTSATYSASSDAASCGCGPYYMQIELALTSSSFTGTPPAASSSAWGSFPWYHSLLNLPNYNAANGWPDNCVPEAYVPIVIPFGNLCAGTTYYVRMREYVEGSASAGPWLNGGSFTTPGTPPSLNFVSMIESTCNGSDGSATINASGGIAPYTFSWNSSPVQTTSTATNLASGTYLATVTDSTGCAISLPVTVGDSCDFVWPGDANDDAVANNFDILDIGIANGATGTVRANASLLWIGQPSIPWGTTLLSGVDYKWVDCNGDGIVNGNDTAAVMANYGYIHNNRIAAPVYDASVPDLTLDFVPDSLVSSSPGTCVISLGTVAQSASAVYGIAFTISFDPNLVDANSIFLDFTNSWLGTINSDMISITRPNAGQLDVAITRMDHVDRNGNGEIARLNFMTTSALFGTGTSQLVPFTLSNYRVNSASGTEQVVNLMNDTLISYDPVVTGITPAGANGSLQILPNPNNGSFTLNFVSTESQTYTIEIMNALGEVVSSQTLVSVAGSNSTLFDLTAHGTGVYFIRVTTAGSTQLTRVFVR